MISVRKGTNCSKIEDTLGRLEGVCPRGHHSFLSDYGGGVGVEVGEKIDPDRVCAKLHPMLP